jgi:hypothetical protein
MSRLLSRWLWRVDSCRSARRTPSFPGSHPAGRQDLTTLEPFRIDNQISFVLVAGSARARTVVRRRFTPLVWCGTIRTPSLLEALLR